ncbi:MAG TPA: DUF3891 family protein [Candidatus Angelobacter sp.]|jgi:hypothetical protein|nr:DUF3891 family protein [Candidatus Angelobacter sp.]
MILRPLDPPPAANAEFLPAWSVVEQSQRQKYNDCWMITQPSHAALAGEFAARLTGLDLPTLDAPIIRAIALHDAGWGMPDAQAIMQSRSASQGPPKSFIACGVGEFLNAWEKSIDVAASASAAGGYIVSRHFERIATVNASRILESDRQTAESFLRNEAARQAQLAAKQGHTPKELETLTDVLQFCDLLSLYVCSGARQNVEFPEYFGVKVRLTVKTDSYSLDPIMIEPGTEFVVAALRHPATKEASGKEIAIKMG